MQSDQNLFYLQDTNLVLTISSSFKVYTTVVRNVNTKTTYQRELDAARHVDNSYTYLAVAKD